MFSRKERDYLFTVVTATRAGTAMEPSLAARFPNRTYRRKLLWSIRRKAIRAAADWQLYTEAAGTEKRILPGGIVSSDRLRPVYSDPIFVPAMRQLERGFARLRRSLTNARRSTSGKRGGE